MTKAFFLDRDGVVNQDPDPAPYVLTWDQWVWMPGIFDLLEEIRKHDFLPILVTSQKGVGKGLMSLEDLDQIHDRMQRELGPLRFEAIYAFTGLSDCPWEAKPSPQMLQCAAQRYDISLEQSWLLGDADRDIAMGRAAGVGMLLRLAGAKSVRERSDFLAHDLAEVLERLKRG
jgi:D-glycero-D-manno-heptose 1,7-bisphosphate phosphatase